MYDHIGLRVKDLEKAKQLYTAILAPLGHVPGPSGEGYAGFGPKDAPALWLHGTKNGGGAHVALRAGVPVEPVAISCAPSMLGKGQPWWDVPERPGRFTIRVLDPIEPNATGASGLSDVLAARWLTATLRERISERLNPA